MRRGLATSSASQGTSGVVSSVNRRDAELDHGALAGSRPPGTQPLVVLADPCHRSGRDRRLSKSFLRRDLSRTISALSPISEPPLSSTTFSPARDPLRSDFANYPVPASGSGSDDALRAFDGRPSHAPLGCVAVWVTRMSICSHGATVDRDRPPETRSRTWAKSVVRLGTEDRVGRSCQHALQALARCPRGQVLPRSAAEFSLADGPAIGERSASMQRAGRPESLLLPLIRRRWSAHPPIAANSQVDVSRMGRHELAEHHSVCHDVASAIQPAMTFSHSSSRENSTLLSLRQAWLTSGATPSYDVGVEASGSTNSH